jgi:hypothetical protein
MIQAVLQLCGLNVSKTGLRVQETNNMVQSDKNLLGTLDRGYKYLRALKIK